MTNQYLQTVKPSLFLAVLVITVCSCTLRPETANQPGPSKPPGTSNPSTPSPPGPPSTPPGANEVFAQYSSGAAKSATGFTPALIQRYHVLYQHFTLDDTAQELIPYFRGIKYQPRQSTVSRYVGWDVLNIPPADVARHERSDWLSFVLNRPAKVVLVWNRTAPWLGTWKAEADSDGFKVFSKDFAAGEHQMPSPGIDLEPYKLLLAEQNGRPSSTPPLPAQAPAGATVPAPNSDCPTWLHNLYNTKGNDGAIYDSWHPQIEPVYWCYFNHEHGSDPSLIGYSGAALGYVAKINFNQNEVHHGFKGYVIRDDETHIGWYVSVHSETGFENRVCAQFHTVVVAAVGLENTSTFKKGELLAELSLKGDFGASIVNKRFNNKEYVIKKTTSMGGTCADQEAIYNAGKQAGRPAVKMIRVASEPFGNDGYEVWNGGLTRDLGFSYPDWSAGLSIDIENPTTGCATLECASMVRRGDEFGDVRKLTLNYMRLAYSAALDTTDSSPADGVFYSNLYGTQFYGVDGPNRIHQFVKPGLDVPLPQGQFQNADAWRGLYFRDGFPISMNLEDSLAVTN